MGTITVYTRSERSRYNAAFSAIDRARIEYILVRSTPEILRLMRHTNSGEHLQAPVVITDTDAFSGYRPDRIARLTPAA